MTPRLRGIDHVHVYVASRQAAEVWYRDVLGFRRAEAFAAWAVEGGPLTLENPEGTVHVALFETRDGRGSSTIAFGAGGEQFLAWKEHLARAGLDPRLADHDLSFSLYFSDPDGNTHEITTYDHAHVAARLTA